MSKERLYIFDTTLRDGAQTQGVHFSIDEKTKIAHALDDLGVDFIEGGWPGANPSDTEFFQKGLDLKIFSPSEPIGILIISLGLIFSGMIFYIIYAVSTNKESLEDKKIRTQKESIQREKIGKLFPKKK